MEKVYENTTELIKKTKQCIGVPFNNIDKNNRLTSGKGGIGQMIEESHFGIEVNNRPEPDFKNLGIECKVTPFIRRSNKYVAKERLVLNIINYETENLENFFDSHFWIKSQKLLILFYEYQKDKPKSSWYIDNFILNTFSEEDLNIIKNDWDIITSKIKNGKAHELSEGDTMYLAACTKGANAKSMRSQPFSNVKAKQRAFSFKASYMTYLLNSKVYTDDISERLIKNPIELTFKNLESIIIDQIKPYYGMDVQELKSIFKINTSPKSLHMLIISKIFNIKGRLKDIEEFQKARLIPKTITVDTYGTVKESMSFAPFSFKNIITTSWEESDFYEAISESKFLFIIFQKDKYGNTHLKKSVLWNMSPSDIIEVEDVWTKTKNIIKEGVILTPSLHNIKNNLPKAKDSKVAHVRPHAAQSAYSFNDTLIGNLAHANQLPDGRWMTKQSFWLNSSYIEKIIK